MKTRIISGLDFRGKRVLLVGLGVHGGGIGTAKWLVKQGAEVRVTDKKSAEALQASVRAVRHPRVSFFLGGHRSADFRWADVIVLNPDVPPRSPELKELLPRNQNVVLANELTLFLERCPAKTIGITGTRGKTSTTLLITHILTMAKQQAIASGNVRGEAMLTILPRLRPTDVAVLELSSFQLELLPEVQRSVSNAIMTNLHVDHLSRHGTMDEYAQAKANVFRYQTPDDVAILNYDNAWVRKISTRVPGKICWYTLGRPHGRWCMYIEQGMVMERAFGADLPLFPISAWPIAGDHQRANLLAAVAAVRVHGVPGKTIARAIKTWRGVPHRQEIVRTWKRHRYINDTTATSPDGALAALQVYPKALFIVGGTDKQLTFGAIARAFARNATRLVFLPGTATVKLQAALRRAGWKGSMTTADSMEQAVLWASQQARPGQDIILSPGAASFGLFLHEFDRGEKFVAAVRKLGV